jgi:hypothetical protein
VHDFSVVNLLARREFALIVLRVRAEASNDVD